MSDSATLWTASCQASQAFTISWTLQTHIHWIDDTFNHLILCHPILLLPSIFPSINFFFSKLALHVRWPEYWIFSFSISPFKDYSRLISFKIDWFDFLAVQGSLKSPLQHHSPKASVLWHSACFMVQLTHPYTTIGKTIALILWILVSKVMSPLFHILSR